MWYSSKIIFWVLNLPLSEEDISWEIEVLPIPFPNRRLLSNVVIFLDPYPPISSSHNQDVYEEANVLPAQTVDELLEVIDSCSDCASFLLLVILVTVIQNSVATRVFRFQQRVIAPSNFQNFWTLKLQNSQRYFQKKRRKGWTFTRGMLCSERSMRQGRLWWMWIDGIFINLKVWAVKPLRSNENERSDDVRRRRTKRRSVKKIDNMLAKELTRETDESDHKAPVMCHCAECMCKIPIIDRFVYLLWSGECHLPDGFATVPILDFDSIFFYESHGTVSDILQHHCIWIALWP